MSEQSESGRIDYAKSDTAPKGKPMDIRPDWAKGPSKTHEWGSKGSPYTPGELAPTSKQSIY